MSKKEEEALLAQQTELEAQLAALKVRLEETGRKEKKSSIAPPLKKPRESIGGGAMALSAKPPSKPRPRRGSLTGGVIEELKCKQQGVVVSAGPSST
jgi:hypothetical protein